MQIESWTSQKQILGLEWGVSIYFGVYLHMMVKSYIPMRVILILGCNSGNDVYLNVIWIKLNINDDIASCTWTNAEGSIKLDEWPRPVEIFHTDVLQHSHLQQPGIRNWRWYVGLCARISMLLVFIHVRVCICVYVYNYVCMCAHVCYLVLLNRVRRTVKTNLIYFDLIFLIDIWWFYWQHIHKTWFRVIIFV